MDYYFFWWIVLIAIALWSSFAAFFWALRSGQFSDQERARYIPLRDQRPGGTPGPPSRPGLEIYVLLLLGCLFIGAMAVMLAVALRPAAGS